MTSEEWICVEETPDADFAARVESFLRDHGVPVRVAAGSTTAGGVEVQVPMAELARAVAELEDLDGIDDERRG